MKPPQLCNSQPGSGWKTLVSICAGILFVSAFFLAVGSKRISSKDQPSPRSSAVVARNTENPRSITSLASLPPEAQASISAALGRDLPGYETRISQGGRVQTGNSQQKLAASFTDQAVEPRQGNESWRIALRSYGYGDDLKSVTEATPAISANR